MDLFRFFGGKKFYERWTTKDFSPSSIPCNPQHYLRGIFADTDECWPRCRDKIARRQKDSDVCRFCDGQWFRDHSRWSCIRSTTTTRSILRQLIQNTALVATPGECVWIMHDDHFKFVFWRRTGLDSTTLITILWLAIWVKTWRRRLKINVTVYTWHLLMLHSVTSLWLKIYVHLSAKYRLLNSITADWLLQ